MTVGSRQTLLNKNEYESLMSDDSLPRTKTCRKCLITKPVTEFRPSEYADGFAAQCLECRRTTTNAWHRLHHVQQSIKAKAYYQQHKEIIKARVKEWKRLKLMDPEELVRRRALNTAYRQKQRRGKPWQTKHWHKKNRLLCIAHYSSGLNRCACCGESHAEFLAIDHINGGGHQHRKTIGNFFRWLIRNGFPDGFRVLCHNCNMALAFNGYCPHQRIRNTTTDTVPGLGSIATS